jgi:hypothetical protein
VFVRLGGGLANVKAAQIRTVEANQQSEVAFVILPDRAAKRFSIISSQCTNLPSHPP